jgi:L-histidine N-alpha-methyltransferase
VFQTTSIKQRLQIQKLLDANHISASRVGNDVVEGLTQMPKSLPPCYFYDDLGSQLFEQICELPEYYVTRTETAILRDFASEIATMTGPCELVELGSGNSTKTRILLDAYQQLGYPLRYLPIDVCAGILQSSAMQLLEDYPSLHINAIAGTYESALAKLEPTQLPSRMICFIGSSIGNLNPAQFDQFCSQVNSALQPGEYFLLGIDLQKPKDILAAAYNDSQGVTAAFNLNMLTHLNQRFQGDFDITQFTHWAFYNDTEHQIEMHLRSLEAQTVKLKSLNLTVNFAPGETILTEISRKFDLTQIQETLTAKGLVPLHVWTDVQQWFGVLLCQHQAKESYS